MSEDKVIRLILLQFSFSNPEAVPASVRSFQREKETQEEMTIRKMAFGTGVQVLEPVQNVSLADILEDLEGADYQLVVALHQERTHPKDPRRKFQMVRFEFTRREFVYISKEFKAVRDVIRADLKEMCRTALWRVRTFLNPLYRNGEEVDGQYALSINLEARQPLSQPDGRPVMVWQKDEKGERVGNEPLPLEPDHRLRIEDGELKLY